MHGDAQHPDSREFHIVANLSVDDARWREVTVASAFLGSATALRKRRAPNGSESAWRVLGASRGEAGILGEGIRQALLRDPTYTPSLRVANTLVP